MPKSARTQQSAAVSLFEVQQGALDDVVMHCQLLKEHDLPEGPSAQATASSTLIVDRWQYQTRHPQSCLAGAFLGSPDKTVFQVMKAEHALKQLLSIRPLQVVIKLPEHQWSFGRRQRSS